MKQYDFDRTYNQIINFHNFTMLCNSQLIVIEIKIWLDLITVVGFLKCGWIFKMWLDLNNVDLIKEDSLFQ